MNHGRLLIAPRSAPMISSAIPSIVFTTTLPVNPSVTITSAPPSGTSRPSTLPMKFSPLASSNSNASCTTALPFDSSSPMFSSPTLGRSTFQTCSMYADAICAHCSRYSGRASAFAPTSSNAVSFPVSGSSPTSDGRSIPRIRPTYMIAPAITAPVFPADTNASASPVFTIRSPTAIDDCFFCRAACAGGSSIAITSGASHDRDRLRPRRQPRQLPLDRVRLPDERHPHPQLPRRHHRALDDRPRRVVPAHGVERDHGISVRHRLLFALDKSVVGPSL